MPTIVTHSSLNISETVRDRGLVPKDHQYEMAYWVSNGHVTDDVTWPRKVKLVAPIRLEHNISITATDAIEQQSLITIVCCEIVRSAILATAWLLVNTVTLYFIVIRMQDNWKGGRGGIWDFWSPAILRPSWSANLRPSPTPYPSWVPHILARGYVHDL